MTSTTTAATALPTALVRPAHEREYAALAALWEASVRATHDFLREGAIEALRPLVEAQYLPAVTLRVFEEDGVVHGFVGVLDGKVEMLFLAPEARGRGIGLTLLQHAIEALGATTVDVNEQNPKAVRFYRRAGFVVEGRSPLDGQGQPYPLLHLRLAAAR